MQLQFKAALCTVFVLATFATSLQDIAHSSPNVIVIITDDAGYADFGFMNGLSGETSEIPTPNLDALAARGVKFSRAYVAANCQPTRAAIVTGGYQQRIGNESVGNNLTYAVDDAQIATRGFEGVPVETDTIWDRMKGLGYSTGAIGKWHLGQHADSANGQVLGNRPQNQGVDEFYGFWHGDRNYKLGTYGASQVTRSLRETIVDPNGNVTDTVVEHAPKHTQPSDAYLTEALGDYAVDFIDDHHDDANPFFLYQSFGAPHKVWTESPDYNDPAITHLSDPRRKVASMMITMDKQVGRILDKLDDPDGDPNTSDGIADDTLVVFINDNGGVNNNPPGTDNGVLNRWKGSPLEGGIRVPMIVAGAGVNAGVEGTTYTKPVHGIDILPTAFAAAGGTFGPAEDKIDGVDILPFINGTDTSSPHDVLVHRWRGNFAVVKGDWKLVNRKNHKSNPNQYELYNVTNDIGETNDVIGNATHSALVAELKRDLTNHEAFFDKPRYAILNRTPETEPLNLFDHFVFRPGVHTDWSGGAEDGDLETDPGVSTNWFEAGTTNQNLLFRSDSFAGAVLEFPTHSSNYTANNDMVRKTGLEFMLNKIILSGTFNSGSNRSATIQGNNLLFTNDLSGVGPQFAVDATDTGGGTFTYDIDLNLIMYDDLTFTGDGDVTVNVNGVVSSYFDPSGLIKDGTSTVALTANNTYTGDTTVLDGTLSLQNDFLADLADVFLTTGGFLNLDFIGTDTIDSLFIDGSTQAVGTWGAIGSGADNETSLITGSGLLMVSTLAGLAGDFDGNGRVDGLDFLKWQTDGLSASDLADWEANYGMVAPNTANVTTVPEPASWAILAIAACLLGYVRSRPLECKLRPFSVSTHSQSYPGKLTSRLQEPPQV